MADTQFDSDETNNIIANTNAARGVNPAPDNPGENIGRGYTNGSNAYVQAFNKINSQRGSIGNVAQAAGIGAASGLAEGVNPQIVDPVANFMSGVAAGLGIPASIAQAKKDQIKSTLDATPLSMTMPALADRYPNLASLPTALAVQTIQKIAGDTAVMIQEHNNKVGNVTDAAGNPVIDPTTGQPINNPTGEQDSTIISKRTSPTIVASYNKLHGLKSGDPGYLQDGDLIGQRTTDWKTDPDPAGDEMKQSRLLDAQNKQQDMLYNKGADMIMKQVSSRSGSLGIQNAKVDLANHLQSMLVPDASGTINLTAPMYEELAIGLARLTSGGIQPAQNTIDNIKQATIKGNFAKALTYATGVPFNGTTQNIIKQLESQIDRQGVMSQKLRDTAVNGIKSILPPGLSAENRDRLLKSTLVNSYVPTNPVPVAVSHPSAAKAPVIGQRQLYHDKHNRPYYGVLQQDGQTLLEVQ